MGSDSIPYQPKATALTENLILPPNGVIPSGAGLPELAVWAVPRKRLADRLDAGAAGLLTLITAPVGAGKTTGVASWAINFKPSAGVAWVKLRSGPMDRHALPELVSQNLSLLVLDDFPARPSQRLSENLELLVSQLDHQLNIVLICSASPAVPFHQLLGSIDLTRIGFDDLVMDREEVELVLAQHEVTTTEAVVQAVFEHTAGWAYGVQVAARSLQQLGSVEAALRRTDEEICRFLDVEVISQIPPAAQEMLVTTSVADEVPPELAHAMAADTSDGLLHSIQGYDGFIDLRPDGSFHCHPLLRKAALARLSVRTPSAVQRTYRRASRWYAEQRKPATAIDLAMKGGDWEWAARALLRSLAVPRILAGAGDDVVHQVLQVAQFGESEPLLLAGAALARSWLDIASSAMARATSELAQNRQPELADELSLALLNMTMWKQRGDSEAGLAEVSHVSDLIGRLSMSERAMAPELSPLIDYHTAGLELLRGNVEAARRTLQRGAGPLPQIRSGDANKAERRIRADCAGQLSWLDAFCGDLRRAAWRATSVLTDRRADSGELGVTFAHLATAWVHLERGEVDEARQRLDHALNTSMESCEPLLAAAQRLTQMRVATVAGEPETALRLLHLTNAIDSPVGRGWFAEQFLVASAEAYLAAGEPEQAIAALTAQPHLESAQVQVIWPRALLQAGDLAAVEKVMARISPSSVATSLVTQLQYWLVQAEIAVEQGNIERAQQLVDRALQAASREELRTAAGFAGTWLRSVVDRDAEISRRYAAFLASLPQSATPSVHHGPDAFASNVVFVVPLTTRETEVLKLLAQFCSNDEIAAGLFVSMNTVKTHMRSLFQKLSVTRRADAVRRGRALGLC